MFRFKALQDIQLKLTNSVFELFIPKGAIINIDDHDNLYLDFDDEDCINVSDWNWWDDKKLLCDSNSSWQDVEENNKKIKEARDNART